MPLESLDIVKEILIKNKHNIRDNPPTHKPVKTESFLSGARTNSNNVISYLKSLGLLNNKHYNVKHIDGEHAVFLDYRSRDLKYDKFYLVFKNNLKTGEISDSDILDYSVLNDTLRQIIGDDNDKEKEKEKEKEKQIQALHAEIAELKALIASNASNKGGNLGGKRRISVQNKMSVRRHFNHRRKNTNRRISRKSKL
jgi:hypothetical protein